MNSVILKISLVFFFIQILTLLSLKSVYAESYFFDNFANGLDKWDLISDGHSFNSKGVLPSYGWYAQNNYLVGEAGYEEWSFLYPKNQISANDYIFQAEVENDNGVDLPIYFRISGDKSNYYQLAYRFNEPDWPDSGNITLWKSFNGSWSLVSFAGVSGLSQNVHHIIKVVLSGSRIQAFLDGGSGERFILVD